MKFFKDKNTSWEEFIKGKKTVRNFSEPFLCKFTKDQMGFIQEQTEIYGSKSAVIRLALKHFREHIQKKDN